MSKLYLRIALLLVVIGLLVGCGTAEQKQVETNNQSGGTASNENSEGKSENTVLITISKENGSEYINEKEVAIEETTILMEVMKENFNLETDYDGGFITSIDGVAPKKGEQKAWMFTVNGKTPSVGAKKYELSPGDKVIFDLHAWE